MKPNRALIEKFLRNECTDKEAALVQKYFEEYADELENYMPIKDWLADKNQSLNLALSERILQRVQETYGKAGKGALIKKLVRYAAAASFIGIVVLTGIQLITGTGGSESQNKVITIIKENSAQILEKTENKTDREMQIHLSDGSEVTISPNSSLQYLSEFEKDRRDLYLKGRALFVVHKDSARPFTVYASGIATTALGTSFWISELDSHKVSVKLIEGSVKVRQNGRNDLVLLRPGDELVADSGRFSNYSIKNNSEKIQHTTTIKKMNVVKEQNSLVFKNHQLKDVFARVEGKFSVTVNYEAAVGIEQKLFTGTFLENDTLEFICKTICGLHNLRYKIDGSVVIISKQ